eukprot:Gb_37818 [translate_table: standard]
MACGSSDSLNVGLTERPAHVRAEVLEKLRQHVEQLQMLPSRMPEMFEAVRDPQILVAALEKFDRIAKDQLSWESTDQHAAWPVTQVYKHVEEIQNLLVAERDAILKEDEPNNSRVETKVQMMENGNGYWLHISSSKWDGAITSILEAIETLGLNVVQASVSCDTQVVFDALLEEGSSASDAEEDVKNMNKVDQSSP